jgi:hypothetical protein
VTLGGAAVHRCDNALFSEGFIAAAVRLRREKFFRSPEKLGQREKTKPQITIPSIRRDLFVGVKMGTALGSIRGALRRQKLRKSRFSPVR